MNAVQVCQHVVETSSCHLVRARKGNGLGDFQYDIKSIEGSKKGWTYLDLFSASAVTKVYTSANEENRHRLDKLSLPTIIKVAFKLVQ